MNKKQTLVALAVLTSCAAQAQSPFFTIEEVVSASDSSGNFGPWALAMSKEDKTVAAFDVTNDWFSFFNMAPIGMDLAHRMRYERYCSSVLADEVCDTYWDDTDNRAKQWRLDTIDYVAQTESLVSGSAASEQDGIVTGMGDTADERVGYTVSDSATSNNYHPRTAFVSLPSLEQLSLPSAYEFDGVGGFSSAYSLLPLANDRYLIGGTANTNVVGPNSALGSCYDGDTGQSEDYPLCPGFNTQASFWLVDGDNGDYSATQASSYYRANSSILQTASVMGMAKVGEGYYAVGYSSTDEVGSSSTSGRNVAVVWPLTIAEDTVTVGSLTKIPLSENAPGEGDEVLRHTWAVAINENGWVIGNQKYSSVKGRNQPIEMFVYNVTKGETADIPFDNSPIRGANSEAGGLNNNGLVVGWRDERNETAPVYDGTPRMQEAFLYNINSGNSWYLNDLICGTDSDDAKACEQNGKFYYVAYANAVADDGTIAATAYRYDSEADWASQNNPTTVTVRLMPNQSFDNDGDVPDSAVITNPLPSTDLGEDDGGGSLGLGLLGGLLGVGLIRRRKNSK